MKILTDTGLVAFWNKIKQLVLGNRPYEPTEFSGKGYKVLEKISRPLVALRRTS